MRKALLFLLKFFFIVAFLIGVSVRVDGQDKRNRTKIHQISLDYSQDFVLNKYIITHGSHYGPIYGYNFNRIRYNEYSYSLGVKYKYYNERCFYFKLGLYYRNQVIMSGNQVYLDGLIKDPVYSKTWLGYFDIPVGIGFSFFNKGIVRPYIEAGINSSLIFHEKADCRFYKQSWTPPYDEVTLESNKLKTYNFKGSINAGCEFHIHKKYVLGVDIGWRSKPLLQNWNSVVYELFYSNYSFGASFGYVIK